MTFLLQLTETLQTHLPGELAELIFSYLSIIQLEEFGASFNQLQSRAKQMSFLEFQIELQTLFGFHGDKRLISMWNDSTIPDTKFWFLCKPVFLELIFSCFSEEMNEYLAQKDRIIDLVVANRLDLLKVIYSNTSCFLNNQDVFESSCENGFVNIVEWLIDVGAAKNSNSMCIAAKHGHFKVVEVLHTRQIHIRGDFALVQAAEKGNIEIVKFMVENGIGTSKISRAYNQAKDHKVTKFLRKFL